jgi:hypothetical protein
MRELGTPGVQETLDTVKEIAIVSKDIMETMKSPEWQQNLENIRLISQNFNQASERMDRVNRELKETGIIDDAKSLIGVAKSKMESFGAGTGEGNITGQDLKELVVSFKEMLESIRLLLDELKLAVAESKNSGTLKNIAATTREASDVYRALAGTSNK